MEDSMTERIEALEQHVIGLDPDRPGLVIRVDRLERYGKTLLWLAGLGFGMQALEVAKAAIAAISGP